MKPRALLRRVAELHTELADVHRQLAAEATAQADAPENDVAPASAPTRRAVPEPTELDRARAARCLARRGYRKGTS